MTSAPVLENAPPTRPAVVTVAYRLQVALVAALLIVVVVSVLDAVHYNGLINEAVRTTSEPDMTAVSWEREDNIAGLLFVGVPLFVLAVWLGISAVLVSRGSNVGRVLTWVGVGAPSLCVLMSCFLGVLGVFAFAMVALPFGDPAVYEDDPDFTGDFSGDAFTDTVYTADSGGLSLAYDIITTTCLMLALLLAVAVVVLLATPPSARYFRRGEPVPPAPVPQPFLSPYATTPTPYATAPFPHATTSTPYAATPFPYAAAPAPYYPAAAGPFPPTSVPMYLPPDPASTNPHSTPGSAAEPPSSGPMYPPRTTGPTYPPPHLYPHAAPPAPWGTPSPSPHPPAAPMRTPSVDPTAPVAEPALPTAPASAAEPAVPTAPAAEPTASTPDASPSAPADGSPPASSGPDAGA
ncbi:MAG: hypothetical protein SYR96_01870 [Actinomycetota bacterium]|nr:hypothetical protein [Actinomycetota bacterium]